MYQRVIICPFVMCLNILGTTFCKDTGSVETAVETLCHPLFVIYLNECEKKERNLREGEGGGGRERERGVPQTCMITDHVKRGIITIIEHAA